MDKQDFTGGNNMINDEMDIREIAIYTRVSTDEQAREGISLEEQKHRLQSYCIAMGWKHNIKFYIDDGYSAKDIDRPQLKKLLEDVKANKIAKVIVTKLDRLSRKLLNLLELIDLFQQNGVSFISISESFDTNTPSGRLTLQVLGAVAEFERERIKERVVDNMHHAAHKGQWLTSAPYGYELLNKELKIHEEKAKVVRRIYDLYLNENKGYLTIAKLLNEESIPSPSGKEWWNRTVKLVLSNPVYKGTTIWNRTEGSKKTRPTKGLEEWIIKENTHEPIIDPETWDLVQEKMSQKALPARAQSSPHLLSGLLKCPVCGGGMSVSPSGSRKNPYKVYRCSKYKNQGTCVGTQYKVEQIHQLFKEGLQDLLDHIPINEIRIETTSNQSHNSASTQQKLYTARKRYERKVEAYTAGLISIEDLKEEKKRLDTMEEVLTVKEEKSIDLTRIEQEIKQIIGTILEALEILPTETVKGFLRELFEKIVPGKGGELVFVFRPLN